MLRRLKDQRGMALLLTLLVIALLTAVTVSFGLTTRLDYEAAANLRDSVRLAERAGSGFEYARALLAVDGDASGYDALTEGWASPEGLAGDAGLLLGGDCEIEIRDQSGLLPVNALVGADGQYNEEVRRSFVRLLVAAGGVGADDAENIVDAVKDWIDADDEVTRFGAESATYLALARPCRCRNAPIATLDELLLVQGMSAELLYGAEGSPGIASSLTVYGREGVVNINTAPTAVLMALADNMDMETAEAMAEYRLDPANDLSSPAWYHNIRGDVNLVGAVVKSEYFEIVATGVDGRMRRTVRGAVRRHGAKKIEVLSWQVD